MTYPLGPEEAQLPTVPLKADEDLLRAASGDANLGPWTGKADGLLANREAPYSRARMNALLVSNKQMYWVCRERHPPTLYRVPVWSDQISRCPASILVLGVETIPCV